MIIALASPSVAASVDDGLAKVERCMARAAEQRAEIVCFPEAFLPGLRGQDFEVPAFHRDDHDRVVATVAQWAHEHSIATILGLEEPGDEGSRITALVIDAGGRIIGQQTKNQLDPSEEPFYVPGNTRRMFEIGGVRFGIAICHEGWRYPETVRWAAVRGARIVFHPQLTGLTRNGPRPTRWGATDSPFYEKAMMLRALENTIWFASVNYALPGQEAATSIISPSGECRAFLPWGEEGVLVHRIDVREATGLLASRYAPERYDEQSLQ